jgi:ferredoxin
MRIRVDRQRGEGHGLCVDRSRDLFTMALASLPVTVQRSEEAVGSPQQPQPAPSKLERRPVTGSGGTESACQ